MTKLGIGDLIRSAFIALWRGGWPMVACLVLWVGAELAVQQMQWHINLRAWLLRAGLALEATGIWASGFGGTLLWLDVAIAVVSDVVRCVFIAAMLRIVLLGRAGPWNLSRGGLLHACCGVLLVSFALTAARLGLPRLYTPLLEPLVEDHHGGVADIGSVILPALTLLFFGARLCLVYPNMAVGRGWGIKQSWRSTTGNWLRLTVLSIGILLGYLIVSGLLDTLVIRLLILDQADGSHRGTLAYLVREPVYRVTLTTLILALSAVAFARLTDFPAARIPGSSKLPEQLADTFK